jgi:hypothetical protein
MADDIETVCKKMVADINAQFAKYEQEKTKKGIKSTYTMSVFLSNNTASKSRSPEEQAAEVVAGRSWTCNGSHMTDAARHVAPKLNGTDAQPAIAHPQVDPGHINPVWSEAPPDISEEIESVKFG